MIKASVMVELINLSEPHLPVIKYCMNSFHAIGLFLFPLKTSENQRFSDVFRGYRKQRVAENRLNMHFINTSYAPVGNYTFKVNNRISRSRCKKCLKLHIKHQNEVLKG